MDEFVAVRFDSAPHERHLQGARSQQYWKLDQNMSYQKVHEVTQFEFTLTSFAAETLISPPQLEINFDTFMS